MKQHKYFNRLAVIILGLLFIPIILISVLVGRRYYLEFERNNEIYYNKLVEYFNVTMFEELNCLKNHAVTLCVNSKKSSSIFYLGEKCFNDNAYWYYEAVNELHSQYNDYETGEYGIYYYKSRRVITKSSCQTLDQYIHNTLALDYSEMPFFSSEEYQLSTLIFGTTNTQDNQNGDMLVGYCSTMGRDADKVLIFYRLGKEHHERLHSLTSLNQGIEFYILGRDTGTIYLFLNEETSNTGSKQNVMKIYNNNECTFPLTFSIHVMSDSLYISSMTFYKSMQFLWLIVFIVLLAVSAAALFFAYRPIHLLISDLGTSVDDGEFETIRHILHAKDYKIQKQYFQIVNLLVDHLIRGGHISRKQLEDLGIDISSTLYYFVFIIEQETFLDGETDQLTRAAEKNFLLRLFITETEDDCKKVAIAFLRKDNNHEVGLWIQQWLSEHFTINYNIKIGRIVDKLDDIRDSFISCYKNNNGSADLNMAKNDLLALEIKENHKKQQQNDILNYLERFYCDADLSQPRVAELFHISTYTLSRLFKNQIGVGFTEYINTKRINHAKELLLTTTDSTCSIAVQVGLPNYNYFLRLFKSITGVSPTVFRNKSGKSEMS
ncbi:MAG: AraC family transcriptional regulator [Clostridiaceae bacterium]|nr:AraC family transcriptional regulator [Clostridiaceae bacterium]